jgi:diguanylate cyclase (GGDEF)-like protein
LHITSDIEPRMPAGAAFLIDELVAFEAGLEPLTSLYSAPLFGEIAEGRFSEARRHGFLASLLLVDIDDFDCIRDRHGRLVADAAMLAVAELLRNRLRREDMVALRDGGTFQVLLMHCDGTGALAKAEALRAAIAGAGACGHPDHGEHRTCVRGGECGAEFRHADGTRRRGAGHGLGART